MRTNSHNIMILVCGERSGAQLADDQRGSAAIGEPTKATRKTGSFGRKSTIIGHAGSTTIINHTLWTSGIASVTVKLESLLINGQVHLLVFNHV